MVNRKAEKANLTFATKLGINPAFVYFDEATGIKITEAIENATPLTKETARHAHIFKEIIHIFQQLHEADDAMDNRYDLFQMIDEYEKLVHEVNSLKLQQIAGLRAEIEALKQVYQSYDIKEAPCHMDAVTINILRDEVDDIYLIDWEYSGMFDPLWDLATLFLSLQLSEEEEQFFLTYYFRREATAEEMQRLHLLKIFLDYYWSLWYIYKVAQGEKFRNKEIERIQRAEHHIATYKMLYEEDVVV